MNELYVLPNGDKIVDPVVYLRLLASFFGNSTTAASIKEIAVKLDDARKGLVKRRARIGVRP